MSDRRGEFNISSTDRVVASSAVLRTSISFGYDNRIATMSFDDLYSVLNEDESSFVRRLHHDVNPRDYGFRGRHLGVLAPPADLIAIRGQVYRVEGEQEKKVINTQYLPQPTFQAYEKMNRRIKEDLGRELLVDSGHRSPAAQLFTLLKHLGEFDYDLAKTLRLVACPGYSEHGYPPTQAIDFATENGVGVGGVDEQFALTAEYQWLLGNAAGFDLELSYPKGNPEGIDFEPWHWRHRRK